jgi:undecaprenyl-diphosphatase
VDTAIVVWVATHRVGALNGPSVWIGTVDKLGAVWIVLAVSLALARRLGARRALALGLMTGLGTFAADSVSFLVKDVTGRTRPFIAHRQIEPLYTVHSSSFPAGHAATAFAGAVLAAAIAPRLAPVLGALALVIGFSRVYDGVHYPTDVVAGAIIGVAVGTAAVLICELTGLLDRDISAPQQARRGQGTSGAAPNVSS